MRIISGTILAFVACGELCAAVVEIRPCDGTATPSVVSVAHGADLFNVSTGGNVASSKVSASDVAEYYGVRPHGNTVKGLRK